MVIENHQIRILDYLHVSARRLLSDSNFFVHKSVFKYINRHYPNKFYFYTTYETSPENDQIMKNLAKEHGNIQPVPLRYYSTNAIYRNSLDWENMSKFTGDFDMIWNNTPEISFELLSWAISKGQYIPCFSISYAHWLASLVDPPIFANYAKEQDEKLCIQAKYFYNFILNQKNYNNSKWGSKILQEGFERLPDAGWRDKVLNKIQPLYLSVDHEDLDKFKPKEVKKSDIPIVVFNHRHNAYTGFSFFMEAIEKVIKIRPNLKFKILITSVGENDRTGMFNVPDEYFLNKETLPFPKYVEYLWQSDIQVGAHTGENQWSMSFLDGMFCNLVPLYRKGHFFDEMFEGLENMNDYGFTNEDDFISKLIIQLENIQQYREKNQKIYDHFRKNWTWDTLIHDWAKAFQSCYNSARMITDSEKFDAVKSDMFPLTWSEIKKLLNVSDQRSVSSYRKGFQEKFEVKQDMTNPEVVFYRKDQQIVKTKGYF